VYIILTIAITILPVINKPVETSIGMGMILTAIPVSKNQHFKTNFM